MIATGTANKRVIIRAIGPSLIPFGVPGALANPTLDLFQGSTLLFSNDDWHISTQQAEIAASGLAPSHDLESAIIWTLNPGQNYTAVVRGQSDGTGVGIVEAYDLDQAAASKLGNISTRGFVDVDDNVMIAGLIAGPGNGTSLKILVRALGPTLSDFGVAGALGESDARSGEFEWDGDSLEQRLGRRPGPTRADRSGGVSAESRGGSGAGGDSRAGSLHGDRARN